MYIEAGTVIYIISNNEKWAVKAIFRQLLMYQFTF